MMNESLKALSDPTRRKIVALLREGDKTAGELGQAFSFSAPTMSHHFAVLRDAGLVRSEKQGQQVIYILNTTVLQELLSTLFDALGVEGKPS